ncbi:MAG: 50S ribosomal protein L22 [Alphaproteobacteria bacterium]|nr:50S ribosomal protein L22 [Alphaproteobacteria bacterium]
MGKNARPRVLADTQSKAIGRNIRTSPRKLNLVAQSIRGKSAENALNELTFSPKRVAKVVKKVLQSAIANAENNHDLDVDALVVSEASVGKNLIMKRFHARARGRGARVEKPFAQITVVVEERRAEEKKAAEKTGSKKKGTVAKAGAKSGTKPAAKKLAAKKSAEAAQEQA